MLVLYFFQGEPGESLDVPNGFMVSIISESVVTLQLFRKP